MNQKPRFKCLINCKNTDRDYDYTSLMVHVSRTHHIKAYEYAKKYKTDRWKQCSECYEFFFDKTSSNDRTYCTKCGHQIGVEKTAKMRKLRGDYCFEKMSEISTKGWETKTINGRRNIGAQNTAKTLRDMGFYEHDAVVDRMRKSGAGASISKWRKEHPEEVRAARIQAEKTKNEPNGYYNSQKHKDRVQKWKDSGGSLKWSKAGNSPIARERARQTVYGKFGKWTTWRPMFSLDSQDLFRCIEEKLICIFGDIKVYYATKHHEFQIAQNRHHAFLDFYVPSLNKIIEFDEEYHERYGQNEKDVIREDLILSYFNNNISLLRVKKEDFLKDGQKVVEQCVSFILDPIIAFHKKENLISMLQTNCRK
jgi:hypothetical protein